MIGRRRSDIASHVYHQRQLCLGNINSTSTKTRDFEVEFYLISFLFAASNIPLCCFCSKDSSAFMHSTASYHVTSVGAYR